MRIETEKMTTLAIRPLSPDLEEVTKRDLNEVPERVADDINALKTWIAQQPHLRARSEDQFLLSYLRGCKFSLEKTKSKIDRRFTMKTKFPELFSFNGLEFDKLLEILRLGVFVFLPTPLNDNGPRMGIFRLGAYSPDKYKIQEVMRVGQLLQDIIIYEDDYAIINGIVGVMDLSNTGAGHFLQMTSSTMKKMAVWNEEATPLRPKAQHFINTPAGFEPIFNMFKPMLSKKQQQRLFVHGSKMDCLYEHVPRKYLPKEYGGENGSIGEVIEHWVKRVEGYKKYMEEDLKYGTDEKLRPGKPIDFDAIFGIDGSFRKLDID